MSNLSSHDWIILCKAILYFHCLFSKVDRFWWIHFRFKMWKMFRFVCTQCLSLIYIGFSPHMITEPKKIWGFILKKLWNEYTESFHFLMTIFKDTFEKNQSYVRECLHTENINELFMGGLEDRLYYEFMLMLNDLFISSWKNSEIKYYFIEIDSVPKIILKLTSPIFVYKLVHL